MSETPAPEGSSVALRGRRGGVAGLPSPHPLGRTLPGLFLGDPVTQQWCAAFDEVLAPVISTLDCYPAHLDPSTAPADAVEWLASWLGLVPDAHLDDPRRRELVRVGSELLRWRGTVRGLRDALAALFPGTVEIVDPGGTVVAVGAGPGQAGPAASAGSSPASEPPPAPYVLVRLIVDDPETVDRRRLAATVGLLVPAHVPHRTEVVATG